MDFKDRVKALRLEKGLTQTQLAVQLDKGESAVRMWEIARSKPDADTLIKLSKFFNCSTDYLLGLSDVRNQLELESAEMKTSLLEEALKSVPAVIRQELMELLNNVVDGYNQVSGFPEQFKNGLVVDLKKIVINIVSGGIGNAAAFNDNLANMTGADIIIKKSHSELQLEKLTNSVQNDIAALAAKINDGINKKIEKEYPKIEYDPDRSFSEQSDEAVFAAIRKIRTDLHMDFHDLLDKLNDISKEG